MVIIGNAPNKGPEIFYHTLQREDLLGSGLISRS